MQRLCIQTRSQLQTFQNSFWDFRKISKLLGISISDRYVRYQVKIFKSASKHEKYCDLAVLTSFFELYALENPLYIDLVLYPGFFAVFKKFFPKFRKIFDNRARKSFENFFKIFRNFSPKIDKKLKYCWKYFETTLLTVFSELLALEHPLCTVFTMFWLKFLQKRQIYPRCTTNKKNAYIYRHFF